MKALSIKQPWAWLIAMGYKPVENRDWPTSFRGDFFIHAGKSLDRDGYKWVQYAFPEITLPTFAQRSAGSGPDSLGGIIGKAKITDCVKESSSPWFFGEFGFVIDEAKPIPFIPYKGQLGFFEITQIEVQTPEGL